MRLRRFLRQTNRFCRSLLFSALGIVFTAFYSIFCLMCWPFSIAFRYRVIQFYASTMINILRVTCHINYHITGLENIPENRVGVALCKHQSAWETFFLPRFFHCATVIVKKELFWVPFFGWGLASMGPIAINRSAQKSAMQQIIDQGKKTLAAGRWIIIFPEGTRTLPGKIGNYRPGGARLAIAAGYPILPIAHNAGHFWAKRRFIKRPGTVQFAFGPLIETTGRKPEEVMEETKNWIERTVQEMDRKFYEKKM